MNQRFLKTSNELPLNVDSMPGSDARKKDIGGRLCQVNGPIPGECLQVGMMILRRLEMSKLPDDENPPYWAFIGLLEWIKACAPAQDAVGQILGDLWSAYPMGAASLRGLCKKIEGKRPDLVLPIAKVNLSI